MSDRNWLGTAFKALSDPIRFRMLRLLAANDAELCVCEFVDALQERQYTISRGLGILDQAGLVEGQKEGRWVYYGLAGKDDESMSLLHDLVRSIPADDVLESDQKRFLDRMSLREGGRCRVGVQTQGLVPG
jgi:ArsR family transcriptional regulator